MQWEFYTSNGAEINFTVEFWADFYKNHSNCIELGLVMFFELRISNILCSDGNFMRIFNNSKGFARLWHPIKRKVFLQAYGAGFRLLLFLVP